MNRQKEEPLAMLSRFVQHKKGIISEYLPWLIIGISVLAIVLIAIFLLRANGVTLIDNIKNLFRFK